VNLLKSAAVALLGSSVLVTGAAHADDCSVDLQHDIRIEQQQIQVLDGGAQVYAIDADNRLWVDGAEVELDADAKADIEQFADGLRDELPRLVDTVNQALALAMDAIQQVTTELFSGSEFADDLSEMLDELKFKLEEHFYHQDDVTFIAQQGDDWMEDAFGEEFEQAISESVVKLSGQLLAELGATLLSGEGSFEQRVEAFAEDIERKAEVIERNVESRAKLLEDSALQQCERFEALAELEDKVQKAIPQLKDAELLRI